MATSGVLNTSAWSGSYGNRYLELSWSRTGFNVAAQTTTIQWTLTSRGTYSGYVTSAPFTVVIDGETVYYSATRIKLYPDQQIASGTKTIQHNTDGTKTIAVSVSAAIYKSSINATGSANYALDLVGMASISKAPNFNDEENPTIEYYNPVGNAITSLQAAISLTGAEVDIAYRDIPITGSSYTFTLTDAERAVLRAATQGSNSRKVRFYLRNVVDGSIYFSWKEVTYTVINANPTIEAGITDVNTTTVALTGDVLTLIRGYSTASASMSIYPQKEATIANKRIEYNGNFTTESVATYSNVESNVFAFIATDSRGNTVEQTIVAPMIDYIKPTANVDNTEQMNTDGTYTLTVSGNYYNDIFGYTSAAKTNTIQLAYRYKAQGGSYGSWYAMSASVSGNTYNATTNITGLDYRTTYIFQCRIIDQLNTVLSTEVTVKSMPVFHWSETDFVFEVPVTFNAGAEGLEDDDGTIQGDCNVTGNLTVGGDIYLDGKPLEIPTINAVYGTWTPAFTTAGAVSSYTTQQGWYQKVGNVVTIGWQIKATMNTGYNDYEVAISGCPFTPTYSAFGGGVAHNIYFIPGWNFEAWSIGTDNLITVRGQPCNATTAQNLNITSYAYYPYGTSSVTMTLSGTICFMTNN